MNEIKVTKINRRANKWEVEYESNGFIKTFHWIVSSEFKPVFFKCGKEFVVNILESNLKNAEKVILVYMANNTFYGTTFCLYTANFISKKLNISYKTVRTAIAHLVELGFLKKGKIVSKKGNLLNQYELIPDIKIDKERIEEMYYDENMYEEYNPMDFISENDLR